MQKTFMRGEKKLSKVLKTKYFQTQMMNFKWIKKQIKKTDEDTNEEMDTTIMPELESEESAAEKRNQQGKGLKILWSSQMLSRLPISLAQLKAENNSEKFKNEITELLYSLYKSNKLTKEIYKSLINII